MMNARSLQLHRRGVLTTILVLASMATCATATAGGKHYYKSFLGRKPPELKSDAAHWVNAPAKKTLAKLTGIEMTKRVGTR